MNVGEYYMEDKDFEEFLESRGGLENGYYADKPPISARGFFGVGNGWLGLVRDLINDLIDLGWDKKIYQVKEKFGGLRFYIGGASNKVHDRIYEAEKLSVKVCETCGMPGELRGGNWLRTTCDEHVR